MFSPALLLLTLSISLLLLSPLPTLSLPTVTRTGKYLYSTPTNSSSTTTSTPSRFYIKGIAYQPAGILAASSTANSENGGFPEPSSYIDPLSSTTNCTRDLPYLKQLGVNTVRVYSVDPMKNHDGCMQLFENAGIYIILDLSLPLNGSIDRSSPSWSTSLFSSYLTTINAFLPYNNILAFNVGNEVVNLPSNTNAAPFVKAAARDVKAYLKEVGSGVLVGYASVDGDEDFRTPLATYLTCGNSTIDIDLYGLNNYEWCGSSTYATSGWQTITNDFSQLQVASYMSEYGCITNPPRLWQEVPYLYSQPVSNVFSGGVAFSYFPTTAGGDYGMVTFSGTNGQTVTTNSDFTRLATQLSNITSPPNTPLQSSVTAQIGSCPMNENSTFMASNTLPGTPDLSVCNCVYSNALSCVVTSAAANSPEILGALIDYGCSLLGSSGSAASCNAIAGNGSSGVYGSLSYCSPAILTSYVFSAWYEASGRNAQACDFSGNATIVRNPPNTASDASAAAASCLAAVPSSGVFTVTGTNLASATGSLISLTNTATGTSATRSATSAGSSGSSSTGKSGGAARRVGAVEGMSMRLGLGLGLVGFLVGSGWVLL